MKMSRINKKNTATFRTDRTRLLTLIFMLVASSFLAATAYAQSSGRLNSSLNHVTEPSVVASQWEFNFRPSPLFNSVKYPEYNSLGILNALALGVGHGIELQTIPSMYWVTGPDVSGGSFGGKYQFYSQGPWNSSIGYLNVLVASTNYNFSANAISLSTNYQLDKNWTVAGNLVYNWTELRTISEPINGQTTESKINNTYPLDKYIDFSRSLSDRWALAIGVSETSDNAYLLGPDKTRRYGIGSSIHYRFSKKSLLSKISVGQHLFDRYPWNTTLFSVSFN